MRTCFKRRQHKHQQACSKLWQFFGKNQSAIVLLVLPLLHVSCTLLQMTYICNCVVRSFHHVLNLHFNLQSLSSCLCSCLLWQWQQLLFFKNFLHLLLAFLNNTWLLGSHFQTTKYYKKMTMLGLLLRVHFEIFKLMLKTDRHLYPVFFCGWHTFSWCSMGSINAAVFPDPVGAQAKSSLPWNEKLNEGWMTVLESASLNWSNSYIISWKGNIVSPASGWKWNTFKSGGLG